MTHPTSMQEYTERFAKNGRMEGFGLSTKTIMPCPFCAAPDWMAIPIMDPETAMKKGAECKECKRSARAIFSKTLGGVSFAIVQSGGPDQPEWLEPKMRKVPA